MLKILSFIPQLSLIELTAEGQFIVVDDESAGQRLQRVTVRSVRGQLQVFSSAEVAQPRVTGGGVSERADAKESEKLRFRHFDRAVIDKVTRQLRSKRSFAEVPPPMCREFTLLSPLILFLEVRAHHRKSSFSSLTPPPTLDGHWRV